jgi:hypothetical protein
MFMTHYNRFPRSLSQIFCFCVKFFCGGVKFFLKKRRSADDWRIPSLDPLVFFARPHLTAKTAATDLERWTFTWGASHFADRIGEICAIAKVIDPFWKSV